MTCGFSLLRIPLRKSCHEPPDKRTCNCGDPALWGFPVGFPWVCMLHCERSGSLDLGEIYQYHPSECCAFDLPILTFAYSLKEKLPRFTAICYKSSHLALGRRVVSSQRDLANPSLERLQLRVLARYAFALLHRNNPFRNAYRHSHI